MCMVDSLHAKAVPHHVGDRDMLIKSETRRLGRRCLEVSLAMPVLAMVMLYAAYMLALPGRVVQLGELLRWIGGWAPLTGPAAGAPFLSAGAFGAALFAISAKEDLDQGTKSASYQARQIILDRFILIYLACLSLAGSLTLVVLVLSEPTRGRWVAALFMMLVGTTLGPLTLSRERVLDAAIARQEDSLAVIRHNWTRWRSPAGPWARERARGQSRSPRRRSTRVVAVLRAAITPRAWWAGPGLSFVLGTILVFGQPNFLAGSTLAFLISLVLVAWWHFGLRVARSWVTDAASYRRSGFWLSVALTLPTLALAAITLLAGWVLLVDGISLHVAWTVLLIYLLLLPFTAGVLWFVLTSRGRREVRQALATRVRAARRAVRNSHRLRDAARAPENS